MADGWLVVGDDFNGKFWLERVGEYIRKRKTMRSITSVIIFSKLVKRKVQINVHCCTISRLLVKAYFSNVGFKNKFGNFLFFSHSSRQSYHAILDIQSTRE